MNRVCYRFIHSPYRKEFFIDENRVAYSESDRVRAVLDQYGIEYSRIIYTYDEYRNILYGNSTSPEFSRYSLMEKQAIPEYSAHYTERVAEFETGC